MTYVLSGMLNRYFRIHTASRYALELIEDQRQREGTWKQWLLDVLGFPHQNITAIERVQQRQIMILFNQRVQGILAQGEIAGAHLKGLSQHLTGLKSLLSHEREEANAEGQKLEGTLWYWLGGGRIQQRRIQDRVDLVIAVSAYRAQGLLHIKETLKVVGAKSSDFEALLDSGNSLQLLDILPVEVQLRNIDAQFARLNGGLEESGKPEEIGSGDYDVAPLPVAPLIEE